MKLNLTQKLVATHRIAGRMEPGEPIALRMDQTLTQDATGTLVMLEFDAMRIPRVKTELSVQYVDHNLLQLDYKNSDDHLFLRSAARKFGVWYSPPGNGVSHPVHMEEFGVPGKTLIGSDSHTPAAGGVGMLAVGAGGLEVALVMAGEPLHIKMPRVVGVKLTGRLAPWVGAKDIVLEMLRRYDVDGGRDRIFEYFGPGLDALSAMDRHVIANMGTEMGATSTVFPSDAMTRQFLEQNGRVKDWKPLAADPDATYDEVVEMDLAALTPLIACPSSPGNVVPVSEIEGREIYQAYIGSSANPGLRDFAIPALMVKGRKVSDRVSFDVNPASRKVLGSLIQRGYLENLVASGARIHQAGCNGCIGMGQAPASGRISLRTVPRNFPGRSGTREDQVYLCSPETAAASALRGVITDPRHLDQDYPRYRDPELFPVNINLFLKPARTGDQLELEKGRNIGTFPDLSRLPETIEGPLLLKLGDHISTDEILPAGSEILPLRSNIPAISEFCFHGLGKPSFADRARTCGKQPLFILAGENYGQGSSREHAALAPRYLGVRAVLAKSFARIHAQNLINFGIVPLRLKDPDDWERIHQDDVLAIENARQALQGDSPCTVHNRTREHESYQTDHGLTERQVKIILAGGLIPRVQMQD